MNSLGWLLLDLLRLADTPLYSSYAWLGDRLGRRVSLLEFLALVQELLDRDQVRLWSIDVESGERDERHALPPDLAQRYMALGHADDRYDPLGLTLALGPKAGPNPEADWEVDLDFERGTFDLIATSSAASAALRQLGRYFPDVDIVPETTTQAGGRTRIVGRVGAQEALTRGADTPR
jgi:hypothetical protein